MSLRARLSVFALVVGTGLMVAVSTASAVPTFGIEKFFAGNCSAGHEECGAGAAEPNAKEIEEKKEAIRTAGGYPNFGVTDFVVNNLEIEAGVKVPFPESVKDLRVDVAPGVVTNPQAVPYCSKKDFEGKFEEPVKEVVRGFTKPTCPDSTIIGVNKVITAVPVGGGKFADVPLEGEVYN